MAYLHRFLITFGFLLFGMFMWVILPNTLGLIVFILCGLVGAMVGTIIFKKQASEQQIKEDLQNRLNND